MSPKAHQIVVQRVHKYRDPWTSFGVDDDQEADASATGSRHSEAMLGESFVAGAASGNAEDAVSAEDDLYGDSPAAAKKPKKACVPDCAGWSQVYYKSATDVKISFINWNSITVSCQPSDSVSELMWKVAKFLGLSPRRLAFFLNTVELPTRGYALDFGTEISVKIKSLSPQGPASIAVSGHADGLVKVWEISTGKCLECLGMPGNAAVDCISADFPSLQALTGANDGTLTHWNLERVQILQTFRSGRKPVRCVTADFEGMTALTGEARTLKLWDLRTYSLVRFCAGHEDDVACLSMNLQAMRAVSGSTDGIVKSWDLSNGQCLHTILCGHPVDGPVDCLDVSFPDMHMVASCGDGGNVALWDLADEEPSLLQTWMLRDKVVGLSADFSTMRVVASCRNRHIILMSISTGQHLQSFRTNVPGSLSCSAADLGLRHVLVSSFKDFELWDICEHCCTCSFENQFGNKGITCVAINS